MSDGAPAPIVGSSPIFPPKNFPGRRGGCVSQPGTHRSYVLAIVDLVSHRGTCLLVTLTAPAPTRLSRTPDDRSHRRRRDLRQDAAARIAAANRTGDGAYRRVAALADQFGPRMTGSPALERAIVWAHDTFVADGQENVSLDPVHVPIWAARQRVGRDRHRPAPRRLAVLGLGGTVETPPGGLTAEVAVVSSFDELAKLGASLRGKIVLFNHPFPHAAPPGTPPPAMDSRSPTGSRGRRARRRSARSRRWCARWRSASLGAPHTGQMHYGPGPKIPTAALSVEDAELLARAGRARAGHRAPGLEDGPRPDAPSFNVLAELRGRELPDELVVIGAHIDSWDVGEGAQDDGAGCAIVMESLATLRRLGLVPRRTIRAVLFTSEEEGAQGAKTYAEAHAQRAGAPRGCLRDRHRRRDAARLPDRRRAAGGRRSTRAGHPAGPARRHADRRGVLGLRHQRHAPGGRAALGPLLRPHALLRRPPFGRRHAGEDRSGGARAKRRRDGHDGLRGRRSPDPLAGLAAAPPEHKP